MYAILLALAGTVSVVAGFFLLRKPEALVKASRIANRIVLVDHLAFAHRGPFGGLLIVIGLLLLLVATKGLGS